MNTVFMRYALSREAYFRTEKVSASGDVTTAVFYGLSAVVMILLLLGIPAAPIVRPYKIVVEQKLALCGIGRVKRTAVRTAALTTLLLLASAVPLACFISKGYFDSAFTAVAGWLLVCMAAAGWILFIYELCGNPAFICFHDSDAFYIGRNHTGCISAGGSYRAWKMDAGSFSDGCGKMDDKRRNCTACVETCLNGRNCVCFIGSFEKEGI